MRTKFRLLAIGAVTLLIGVQTAQAHAAPSHAQIQGTGSSWSANAVNQWVSDVTSTGLQVVFTGSGSAQGRKDFANLVTDFAVSDIGYQGQDPITGQEDSACVQGQGCRAFAYEPIVAGGTAFPYQVKVAGKLVRNLRLSGGTLAKIFTYQIRNWNDAQITADNNGRQLPSLPIIPVVHSEGSGSTAQFTTYLDKQYPSIWRSFVGKAGFTEYYPAPQGGKGIAQSGSDGVMNFVSSSAANGAIGYDEYSYALGKGWPVAKILNSSGYYTLPDQYNVAVALQHAEIDRNPKSSTYLLQTLDRVYVAPEKQVYPLSSYSYFLIPTGSNDARMTTAKRQTLADYLYYSVCQGQSEMGPIGYSPLPINLVQASFEQTNKLKAADPKLDLTSRNVSTCNNPTFVAGHPEINHLAQIAPLPPACDKAGSGPCGATAGNNANPDANGNAPQSNNGSGGGSTTTGTQAGGRTTSARSGSRTSATTGAGAAKKSGAKTVINPDTGQAVTSTDNGSQSGDVQGVPTDLAAYRQQNMTSLLGPLVALEIVAVVALPPIAYFVILRRRRSRS
jgi:ABC-type phosphate transport system substrate-binding protein